jgi:WD40 repeat protein
LPPAGRAPSWAARRPFGTWRFAADAAPGKGGSVRLWRTISWQEHAVLAGHTDLVSSVAFAPDGRKVASTSKDGTIKLWSIPVARPRIAQGK